MPIAMNFTKLVVRDVEAAERFYLAIGLKQVSRNTGGEGNVRQQQSWLSATGDNSSHILILSRFLELPEPPRPAYPGQAWLVLSVDDVRATCRIAQAHGGGIFREAEDQPDYGLSAAVIFDNEGHHIELIGPMMAG